MHKTISLILFALVAIIMTGCAQTHQSDTAPQMDNLLLAEPKPISGRAQLAIVRYNQILSEEHLTQDERAELHFQRGMLYDSVGLPGLAQYDFSRALNIKPDMAPVYNSMGIHFIQQSEFIQAYEAFDSTLDIDPEYDFAFLNRGIALYYGGRSDLAVKDLTTFYKLDTSDPFRAIWLYFAMEHQNPAAAPEYLTSALNSLEPQHWATQIVELLLGRTSEKELLGVLLKGVTSQTELTERLCEAYFYLGKYHMTLGNEGRAANYFKLALSTNVYDYVEHRYARLELSQLRHSETAK